MLLDDRSAATPVLAAAHRGEILEILRRHGAEAGHYTVLGPDPWHVLFSAQRDGFVSFLQDARTILVWRSPVATPGERGAIYQSLAAHAKSTRRTLVALQVDQETCDAAVDVGHTPLWTGVEAFVDLTRWSMGGGRRQKLRWARSHASKLGIEWREVDPVSSETVANELSRVERAWKAERKERKTDSFLRTDYRDILEHRRFFAAYNPEGRIVSFVTCSRVNDRGWYLQDPVRVPDAPRGALEGSLVAALDAFASDGFEFATNGPLPFWPPDQGSEQPHQLGPVGRLILDRFDGRFRFSGINQFRSKLEPDRTTTLYVVRSHRYITPWAAARLVRILNNAPKGLVR